MTRASLPALRRAATRRTLPAATRAWARARGLSQAEARRRLVHASVVPPTGIGPMRASELLASIRLDAIDRSLAEAYRSLAAAP